MSTLSRRRFLASAGLTGLGGLLISCGAGGSTTSDATSVPIAGATSAPTSVPTIGATSIPTAAPTSSASSGIILAEAHSSKPRQSPPSLAPGDVQAFAAGHNAFGFDLYGRLRAGGGNLFFSPYSIAQVLTMASAGA